jgi:hypothetical protein
MNDAYQYEGIRYYWNGTTVCEEDAFNHPMFIGCALHVEPSLLSHDASRLLPALRQRISREHCIQEVFTALL